MSHRREVKTKVKANVVEGKGPTLRSLQMASCISSSSKLCPYLYVILIIFALTFGFARCEQTSIILLLIDGDYYMMDPADLDPSDLLL